MSTIFAENMHVVGDTVRVFHEFLSPTLHPERINPGEVRLIVIGPDGEPSVEYGGYDEDGLFSAAIALSLPGQWWYRWESDDPQLAYQGSILAGASIIARVDAGVYESIWGGAGWGEFPWPTDQSTTSWGVSSWGQNAWG